MGGCQTKGCGDPLAVVLHIRRMPKCNERQGNPGLRGDSVELGSREGLLVCAQSPTSVRNGEDHGFIRLNNIQLG